MKRHWSSLLGWAAGALCVFSGLNSLVSVVPWIEYDFYRDATALCAVAFALAVVLTVLTVRRRRYCRCGLGCVCLLVSGFFLFANATTFSGLSCVRDVGASADSFPSVCAAARTVVERIAGNSEFALTRVSSCRRSRSRFCQLSIVAESEEGEALVGSSGGDGSWSVKRRKGDPGLLPKRTVEEVFLEILAHDPSVVSNDDINVEWSPRDGTWSANCHSVQEHRSTGYLISEEFSDFRKWDY